jgi:hypothetical protein
MTDKELIDFIRERVEKSPYGYKKSISPFMERIKTLFKVNTGDFRQNLYHLIYNIDEIPICEHCKEKPAAFRNMSKGYGILCSTKCASFLGGNARREADPNKHVKKMQETNLKRYGSKSPLGNKEIKEKQEQTMLERYGARHAVHSDELINKTISTCDERYGVDYWFQSEAGRKMSSENITLMHETDHFRKYFREKYGVNNWYQTECGLKHLLKLRGFSEEDYDNIETYLTGERIPVIADRLNITPYMLNRILRFKGIEYKSKHGISGFEDEVYHFLCTFVNENEILRNDRSTLNGLEIDILIPSKKIGIECNGIFWHSEEYKRPTYHRDKYLEAEKSGINLIQITDLFYYQNKEKWHSLIKNKLGVSKRLYARNYRIVETRDTKRMRLFIDENHIQGFSNATWYLTLQDELENIVAVATFSKSRYNKKFDYELVRFCSLSEFTVVGGFSKLVSHFVKNIMNTGETLLSYANCFWSNGNVYAKTGFDYVSHTGPNYIWTDSKKYLPSHETQKHKLIKEYGSVVESEVDFMSNFMGMRRYYDAGNKIYVLTKQ